MSARYAARLPASRPRVPTVMVDSELITRGTRLLGAALFSSEPSPALEIGSGPTLGEVQVLVINTGGTIGMVPQSEGE